MNDQYNSDRSRRTEKTRRKTSQFDAAKARSKRPVAQKGEDRRKDPLAGRGGGRVHQEIEGGTVVIAFIQPMEDPETGRNWERVFLFGVETPEDIEAAEAWLEEHYPDSKEGGQ